MGKHIINGKTANNRRTLIVLIFVGVLINSSVCATRFQTETSMNTQHTTLWQLIDILDECPVFTLDVIGHMFQIDFSESHRTAYFSSYEGGPLHLADQIDIKKIELRIRRKDGVGKLMGLDVGGVCVTLDDVLAHHPGIVLAETPRGHSLNEATFYSIRRSREELSFGFKESNPHCLAIVVFDRSDPLPVLTK